jgi:heme-degrading monooxygenase HmoA
VYGFTVASGDAQAPTARAVTVHRFTVRAGDARQFADTLIAVVQERSRALPGLLRVFVLREGSSLAVLAEWDSHESETAGVAALYQKDWPGGDLAGARLSENHHYSVLEAIDPKR